MIQAQAEDPSDHRPLVDGGPIGAHNLVVVGTFFMLREIEASLLLFSNVAFNEPAAIVAIKLPCGKTDPAAASVERSWGCLCNTNTPSGCPYHCAMLQRRFLRKLFDVERLRLQLPFFPTWEGVAADKLKVVETFEALHHKIGAATLDDDGHRLLGGHSLRLAGARLLSASGMRLYAQSAPLAKITQEFEQAKEQERLADTLNNIKMQVQELQRSRRALPQNHDVEPRVAQIEEDLCSLDERTQRMIREDRKSVV